MEVTIHATAVDAFDSDKNWIFRSGENLVTRVNSELFRGENPLFTVHSQLSVLCISPSVDFIAFYCQTVVKPSTSFSYACHYLLETVTALSCVLSYCALWTFAWTEKASELIKDQGMVPSTWYWYNFCLCGYEYFWKLNVSVRVKAQTHLPFFIRSNRIQFILVSN